MGLYKQFKNFLYRVRVWCVDIFFYPPSILAESDYDAYWSERRSETLGQLSDWQKERADIVSKLLKDGGSYSVLDVGSGDGAVLKYLQEKGFAHTLYGSDISEKAREAATRNGLTMITLGEGKSMFEKAPPVDVIFFFEVLEHLPNSEVVLAAAKKHARIVAFSIPNTGFIVHRLRLAFGRFPKQWKVNPGEHLRFWTLRDLKWWLRVQGYTFTLVSYKGVPVLNKLWPALFAEGSLVVIK